LEFLFHRARLKERAAMFALLVAVLLAPPKSAPKPPESKLPPEARRILDEYASQTGEIHSRFERKVRPLIEKMRIEVSAKAKLASDRLRKLQDAETKAGNLEGALAIKNAIASLGGGAAGGGQAPADSVEFNGRRYKFLDEGLTWHKAKERCEELGGHLATVNSAEELAFLVKLCRGRYAYLGGTDENREGQWEWITGEPWDPALSRGFDNGKDVEHWLLIRADGQINDGAGGHRMGFVCEWE
jgi:hypothetical protein